MSIMFHDDLASGVQNNAPISLGLPIQPFDSVSSWDTSKGLADTNKLHNALQSPGLQTPEKSPPRKGPNPLIVKQPKDL